MPVAVNDVLHVLAHELRTPVGIAHGYVRLLLEDRLPAEKDRRRALEQMQKALGRLTDLSHETTALAGWYEHDREAPLHVDARELMARVADAAYEAAVAVDFEAVPSGVRLRTTDGDAVAKALIAVVRATARELRGDTCQVIARVTPPEAGSSDTHPQLEMLTGLQPTLAALAAGRTGGTAGPVALERGGLGLALIHAAVVLDAHGAERWTIDGSRQMFGIRVPLLVEERRRA